MLGLLGGPVQHDVEALAHPGLVLGVGAHRLVHDLLEDELVLLLVGLVLLLLLLPPRRRQRSRAASGWRLHGQEGHSASCSSWKQVS